VAFAEIPLEQPGCGRSEHSAVHLRLMWINLVKSESLYMGLMCSVSECSTEENGN